MKAPERIGRAFLRGHPDLAAEILEEAPDQACADYLDTLAAEDAARVLQHMLSVPGARCLAAMQSRPAADVMKRLPRRAALELLRRMPGEGRDRLLQSLPSGLARNLRNALKMYTETVATLADTQVLSVPGDTRVERAMRLLGSHESVAECHLYVVEDNARLVGAVPVRELIAAPASAQMARLVNRRIPKLPGNASAAGVMHHAGWKRYSALPVIDNNGCFIGVLRRDQLGDMTAAPTRRGGGVLDMALALLEAYVATGHVMLAAMTGDRQRGDRS